MKTILITGATAGIGRHAALTLARRGHRVIATGRREHALRSLEQEASGLALHGVRLDVTDPDSVRSAVTAVDDLTDGYGVDVLINNAGYGQLGATLEVPDAAVRAQFETNVFGLLAVTRAFADAMVRRGSGRIVNISSIGGRFTLPLFGVYTATKYAVESLSDALRRELGPLGVQVSIVEPGNIKTEFEQTAKGTVERTGPWADVYTQAESAYGYATAIAPDPTPISRVLTHIVETRRPKARYVRPWRDAAALTLLNLLPTRLADAVMRWGFALGAVRRPARIAQVAA